MLIKHYHSKRYKALETMKTEEITHFNLSHNAIWFRYCIMKTKKHGKREKVAVR